MQIDDCFYLGYIVKPFGYQGELSVLIDADDPHSYHTLESVFLLIEGKLIPFFIGSIRPRPDASQLVLSFEGIENQEQAQRLSGCEIYLPLSLLPPLSGDAFYYHEMHDYSAYDKEGRHIGLVVEVMDLPGNPLFRIIKDDQEILIPLRDEFIIRLDRSQRKIFLNPPEGLIDLYLES